MEAAKEDIDMSISLDPYNGWAYRNKGIYYLKVGLLDDAIRSFRQAEDMDPFIERIYYYMGEAYLQQGNVGLACEYFEKALGRKELTENEFKQRCNPK
jgi:tetratricopeptide (TPR) repeat protein